MTYAEFIQTHGLTYTCDVADSNPNMEKADYMTRHFLCTFTKGRDELAVPFSQGSAHVNKPTAEEVLETLASDATSEDMTFEDWCADFGYDTDSRSAERTYNAVMRQTNELRSFLGALALEELLEVEQA